MIQDIFINTLRKYVTPKELYKPEVFKVVGYEPLNEHSHATANFSPENINLALALIEEHELIGASIVLHPPRYQDILLWFGGYILLQDDGTFIEISKEGIENKLQAMTS